jgi:hypothetical protein
LFHKKGRIIRMFKGVISSTSTFPYNGKNLHSFQVQGIRAYFRTGESPTGLQKGDYVEFEAKGPDAKGNYQVDANAISKKPSTTQSEAKGPTGFRKAFVQATASRDFPTKDERAETQARIEIQSCRNSALQLIDILFKQEAVKLAARADKVAIIEELLEHYTTQFLERNKGKVGTPSNPAGNDQGQSSPSTDTDIL